MTNKIKNKISITKAANGTYTLTWMTFYNGMTVGHRMWSELNKAYAHDLKNQIENDVLN